MKQIGELEIVDMMSYMKALSKFEKGQTVIIKIERDGNVEEVELTF